MAKTWFDWIYSEQELAFCCNGLLPTQLSAKTTWKDIASDGQDGRKQAPTPILAKDSIREKEGEGTPHRSVGEAEMVTQTIGSTQACVRLASVWESLGKRSVLSPPTPAHTNTLLPCLEHMVHQQRHLAALTPGSCASSSPVGRLGTATSSTTCGSSRVKRQAMNYSGAAAANLTFSQEIDCKHMTAHAKHTSTRHPHANAWLITCLVFCAKGFVSPRVMELFIWGQRWRMRCDDYVLFLRQTEVSSGNPAFSAGKRWSKTKSQGS